MMILRIAAVMPLVLALCVPVLAQELPDGLRPAFDEGVRALKAGDLDAAEAAFQSVLAKGGGGARVHNNLGIVYQERGQHERAIREFRAAARLDRAYAAPRMLLGASLLALGRVVEARAELERAIALAPREPLARLQLAKVHERSHDWINAVKQYRTLRDLAPSDPEYVYGLGKAYLRLSEWCLRELETSHPGSPRAQQALGHIYRVQGRTDQALRAFARAAEIDPSLPEIHLTLAQIHMEKAQWAEARAAIEHELALLPDSAGARALEQQLVAAEASPRAPRSARPPEAVPTPPE
jgi:tetratricopeptide (TPR) repeat protein